MVRNAKVIHKWYFPIFTIGAMGIFYINDNTSITATGSVIAMILTFIGIAVTERMDKMIEQNVVIVEKIEDIEEDTRQIGFSG